jgi:hypothetical protein
MAQELVRDITLITLNFAVSTSRGIGWEKEGERKKCDKAT